MVVCTSRHCGTDVYLRGNEYAVSCRNFENRALPMPLWSLNRDPSKKLVLIPISPLMSTRTPRRITFSYLTPNNLGVVRKLNSVLFPIKYSEKFYQDILLPEVEDFCQLSQF